jgi:CRP-like cAMP-binding protein
MQSQPLKVESKSAANGESAREPRSTSLDIAQIRSVPWLRDLSVSELAELQRSAWHRRYAAGDQIFAPTSTPNSVFVLESGLARIYRIAESGAETGLGYVAPGEVFGELSAFGEYPRESFAQAIVASGVWRVGRDAFQRLLAQRPGLVPDVTRQISERLKRAEARIEDLVVRTVRGRVARMILELAGTFGRRDGERLVVDLPVTQGELATLVGATRQTVNQVLGELTDEGVIGQDRRRLVVLDRDALGRATAAVQAH